MAQMRQTLRNSIADNGALYPVIQLLGGGSLQAMLLAWIPIRFGEMINTGIYAVDMFGKFVGFVLDCMKSGEVVGRDCSKDCCLIMQSVRGSWEAELTFTRN